MRLFLMILICSGLAAQSVLAADPISQARTFHEAFDNGDFQAAADLGSQMIKQFPEDEMIQYKYAHACYQLGRFETVLDITRINPTIPNLTQWCSRAEDLGFAIYAFALWKLQIMSLAASGHTAQALEQTEKIAVFKDPSVLFLRYLLLSLEVKQNAAPNIKQAIKPLNSKTSPGSELYAVRIFPAMEEPGSLDRYLASATSYHERCLLRTAVGFQLFLSGNSPRGLDLMQKAMQEADLSEESYLMIAVYSLCRKDPDLLKAQLSQKAGQPRWRKLSWLNNEFAQAYWSDADYHKSKNLLEQILALTPGDTDNILVMAMLHLLTEDFEKAESTLERVVRTTAWNSTNVVCAKLYLPLVRLFQNKIQTSQDALDALAKEDLPLFWTLVAGALLNRTRFDLAEKILKGKAEQLCVLLTIRAMQAEIEGDYISSEKYYAQIVMGGDYYNYSEFTLAHKRLSVVAPLAAVQKMTMK